jgi:hypothetical protein
MLFLGKVLLITVPTFHRDLREKVAEVKFQDPVG